MVIRNTIPVGEDIQVWAKRELLYRHGEPFSVEADRFIALPPLQCLSTRHQGPPSFVTVICLNDNRSVTADWLQELIEDYQLRDDVFRKEFLSGVIFTKPDGMDVEMTPGGNKLLESLGTAWIDILDAETHEALPQPGPYIAFEQRLFEIWKLYDDIQGAFMAALIPGSQSLLAEFRVGGEYVQTVSIAVPSRLRDHVSPKYPLSGLRVAVKDIFHIRGLRTSVCNRAYYALYQPPLKSAACIEILHKAGAVILGTTKLASFAATEEPVECVDFQAPWNPRGDGYQSPAGSSSGSGVAIASYPWLDISIGSDTSGSGRRPGHWNGCFAMRPSHGVLPLEGYIPSFRQFDTPTFFGRDIKKCKEFAEVWYGKELSPDGVALPPSIIYATDYLSSISNSDQIKIIDQFVADLESSLGVKQEKVSFNALWENSPPSEAEGLSLQAYMKDACRNSFFHDDYHSFDNFREDYQRQFSKKPYVSPPVQWQWNVSVSITEAERNIAVERLEIYRKWFSKTVMRDGQYDSVVILPIENISPRYRDETPAEHFYPIGVPMLFLSPILGGPDLVVPAGQAPYQSRVSGRTEHLPVGISLLASPGRDIKLLDLAWECLEKAGRPTDLLTGREAFLS